MARQQRDSETLLGASEDILYELWMLNRLSRLLVAQPSAGAPEPGAPRTHHDGFTHTTAFDVYVFPSSGLHNRAQQEVALVAHNALIEAFALHARVVLDFLYIDPHRAKKDDVIAEDFFKVPARWTGMRPAINQDQVSLIKDRVGAEVAHLTYLRQQVDPEEKGWPIQEILGWLNAAAACFFESVSSEFVFDGWRSILSDANDEAA